MKQPELGQKILELRKAKGLTQEELVERCNINVRTIQRIEAGEVTPRSFTIKTILDVLGYDYNAITPENSAGVRQSTRWLKAGFYVGVIYLLLSFVEAMVDYLIFAEAAPAYTLWESPAMDLGGFAGWFITIKLLVMCTFIIFMLGFYKLSFIKPNTLLRGASTMLMVGAVLAATGDIYGFYSEDVAAIGIQVGKSILFGALYVVFAIGVIKYQNNFGSLATVAGLLGLVSGVALLTVVFALPGLIVLTLFEVLLLILLFQSADMDAASTDYAQSQSPLPA